MLTHHNSKNRGKLKLFLNIFLGENFKKTKLKSNSLYKTLLLFLNRIFMIGLGLNFSLNTSWNGLKFGNPNQLGMGNNSLK